MLINWDKANNPKSFTPWKIGSMVFEVHTQKGVLNALEGW